MIAPARIRAMRGILEDPDARARIAAHAARLAVGLVLAVITFLLFSTSSLEDVPFYRVGAVARKDVIAPFAFRVPKTPADLERERRDAMRRVEAVFDYSGAGRDASRAALDAIEQALAAGGGSRSATARLLAERGIQLTPAEAAFAADPARRRSLVAAIESVMQATAGGVAASDALPEAAPAIVVRRGSSDRRLELDSVLTVRQVIARTRRDYRRATNATGDAVIGKLLAAVIQPTLLPDRALTTRRRQEAARTVDPWRFEVREGEKIIGAHDVVGRETFQKLAALRTEIERRKEGRGVVARTTGAILSNALLLIVFGIVVMMFRPQVYGSMRAMITITLCFLVVIVAAALLGRLAPPPPVMIPIGLAAIVLSVLFDPRMSVTASLVLAALIATQSAWRGSEALFFTVVGGATAAFSVRALRRRSEAYVPILAIGAAYLLASLALKLVNGVPFPEWIRTVAWGALNAIVSVGLAMMLLPAAEDLAGMDTDMKLLEWSDLNRPLMRRLSLEAPGTYAHTMAMANLAEAASNAIGANGLLARVGAYYHDIGKLRRPHFFIENQPRGRNPHDQLRPSASAEIIRSHISDGLALAAEERIPHAIRAFIAQHHGTGDLAYFRERAKEAGELATNSGEFTYPGPIPQTSETAVVMLADGVEAATRVLSEPTPQRIRDVVDHIVAQRVAQGQLREAPLTLRQLEQIKDEFARVLIGSYHNRIDYPVASGGVTAEFRKA